MSRSIRTPSRSPDNTRRSEHSSGTRKRRARSSSRESVGDKHNREPENSKRQRKEDRGKYEKFSEFSRDRYSKDKADRDSGVPHKRRGDRNDTSKSSRIPQETNTDRSSKSSYQKNRTYSKDDYSNRSSRDHIQSSRDEYSSSNFHKDRSYSREDYGNDFSSHRDRGSNRDRYASQENGDSRRNNDRYWNKYPESKGERSVGPRYYGSGDSSSRDKEKRYQNSEQKSKERENMDERHQNSAPEKDVENGKVPEPAPPPQKKVVDMLTSRTGGAYIPPAKLRMMQAQITDKSSAAYQRIAWEALKKSIHGHINKVNTGNIGIIVRELLRENIIRGRGLLCRSIVQAQAASPTFTHVYAALVAVINTKFPNIGELLLRRIVIQFRRGFKRNDKSMCISAATFIAHLVNQRVAHEILALEILTLLVESPTDDSVEVAIAFLKECGAKLTEVSNKGMHAIFEMLRNILHEGQLDKRVQYMIEVIFQVRKDEFRDHVAVTEELDIVEEEEQYTHLVTLEDATDPEDILNVFKFDPEFEANEEKYSALRKDLLGEDSSASESGSGEEESDSEEESENDEGKEETILDNTETNLVALRRTIYLTIQSSLDFEECAHKLMRMELKPGQEMELCHMLLDCCAEQRTYEKFFGLLAQRFCQINKIFIPPFQQIFKDTYDTIHRLDTNKLRNVAKFFAHLLFTDAISWEVLSLIRLNEEQTTSSSRIFIKILFQELSEYMGLPKLNERVKDATLQAAFDGLFPRDNPKNTRFAINFFTSIGLGGLTDELRDHLKSQPKVPILPKIVEALAGGSSSDSSSSSDDSSSDSSSDSDDESTHKKSRSSKKKEKQKSRRTKKKKKKSKHSKKSEKKKKKNR
ncbi:pre-mRNA-splicing factor CWC22 homolog [Anabrus simplex]|uniref:pre-mRNA-splicing factor CWC22 homolog n=1 Tax=Anabrus simplex TaxID=316456 RepID=UPI0035A2884E